jgi:hypothetical protein
MPDSYEQLTVDGKPVDHVQARFSNTFDVEDLPYDQLGICVVVYRVDGERTVTNQKTGARKRTNEMRVLEFRGVDDDVKDFLVEHLGLHTDALLRLPGPVQISLMPPEDQQSFGEVLTVPEPVSFDNDALPPQNDVPYEPGVDTLNEHAVADLVPTEVYTPPGRDGGPRVMPNSTRGPVPGSAIPEGEVVGRIQQHDDALSRFINEGM